MSGKSLVAYYRVSTDRQGKSGLGLEAQQQAVYAYLHGGAGQLVAEYTEVESGAGRAERPALQQAVAVAKRHKATLLIAKLDRLARNVHFISGLMESGVDFVAVDMPHATRLTIHILAAVAEHEREMISQRTRAALAAKKARGFTLGCPCPAKGAAVGAARQQHEADRFARNVLPVIESIRQSGVTTLRGIAQVLNARGMQTARRRTWAAQTVRNVLSRARKMDEQNRRAPTVPEETTRHPAAVRA